MSAGNARIGTKRGTSALAISVALAASALGVGVAAGSGGGVVVGDSELEIRDVTCTERCLDVRTVAETGKVEIAGKHLEGVEKVRFPADEGKINVRPRRVSERSLTAKVPEGARTGRPSVVDELGAKAASPVEIEVEPASAVEGGEDFSVIKAEASPPKSFFNGRRESRLEYLFEADGQTDVRIDVIEKESGRAVDSFVERDQEPYENHAATWNGLSERKRVAPNGRYRFRVSALSGGSGARAGFSYYDHFFPLRGKHTYGDGLGAGRGHQGQDVFAKCGTKLKAARGGKVQVKEYHSAAGYYVVIDGRKTGKDYVYMHMGKQGRPKLGERVRTGDVIGYESDTGNASGCHLHFELWSAPGWYEGGEPLDPTPPLKKWDGWS